MTTIRHAAILVLAAGLLAGSGAGAQESSQDLAKKAANPVANLISVPMQYNLDFGIGPEDASRSTLNIQPVVPFQLSDRWNLITRNILPVVYAEAPTRAADDEFGLGDLQSTFFFSPVPDPGGIIWGIGPAFLFPTGTEDALGTGKWSAGPAGIVLRQDGPWTYGVLADQLWSFAGEGGRDDVNTTFVQPFLNYTTSTATTFFLNTEASYDWEADEATIPVNFGANHLFRIGSQAVQLGGGARIYLDRPDGGPDWGLRLTLSFLFPE